MLPEHQGRGYGRRLLKHVEQVAEAEGSRHLRLYTNKLFAENIRLYEHLGFVVDREESFRGGLVVHMIKELGGA